MKNDDILKRMVLFFYNHEAFWEHEHNLLDDIFFGYDDYLSTRIVVVVSGREKPRWAESAQFSILPVLPEKVETQIVEPFSEADASVYLCVTIFEANLQQALIKYATEVQYLPDRNEIVLAYVIQILLYQRCSLLDGVNKIPVAFNVFARHWISQFRYAIDFSVLSYEVRRIVHYLESLVDGKLVTWDIMCKAYINSAPKWLLDFLQCFKE